MTTIGKVYGYTPYYVRKKMTWLQVNMYYDHALAYQAGKEPYYDEEPDALDMEGVKVEKNGTRVYNR
jgi:hypothetical protein